MFRLGKQVRRHEGRIAFAVGQHQDFAGPGDHVNIHDAVHPAFGGGDEHIAGAHDLVHVGHGLRAVGQRCDGLGAARLHDLGHPRDFRRAEDGGVHLAVFLGRGGHDDFLHPGDFGRHRIHQYRGGIRRRAAGHVQAHALKGNDPLAHHPAVLFADDEAAAHLALVEGFDVVPGLLQNVDELRVAGGEGFGDFFFADQNSIQFRLVKFRGVFLQGLVAVFAHVGDNIIHNGFDLIARLDGRGFKLLRIELINRHDLHHCGSTPCNFSVICIMISFLNK